MEDFWGVEKNAWDLDRVFHKYFDLVKDSAAPAEAMVKR